MALSYFTESSAPRDFRVSSTESDGHYTKCLLCYTVKRNFYCVECIRTGNFVHSSMSYSDRFSEKQQKLLRLKANRKHALERCEKLMANKVKKDVILIEAKQSRDKLDLLRMAIDQRRNNIDEKKKELAVLTTHNNELRLRLPRYHKRVSSLGKHAQQQRLELQDRISAYNDQAAALAALRRSRIRQLTKYIFPVYITYDTSDSIEDMEFICDEAEEPLRRTQLHIVAPWITTDGDYAHVQTWISQNKEAALTAAPAQNPAHRTSAALALAAQLLALLAWTLDQRLPHAIALGEYCNWRMCEGGWSWRARRVCASAAALCARAGVPPPPHQQQQQHQQQQHQQQHAPPHALAGLHALALAAAADEPALGRVQPWLSGAEDASAVAWADARGAEGDADNDDLEPPEHLHWPETIEMEELSSTPPMGVAAAPPAVAPASSLVTSLASMWRGWTK